MSTHYGPELHRDHDPDSTEDHNPNCWLCRDSHDDDEDRPPVEGIYAEAPFELWSVAAQQADELRTLAIKANAAFDLLADAKGPKQIGQAIEFTHGALGELRDAARALDKNATDLMQELKPLTALEIVNFCITDHCGINGEFCHAHPTPCNAAHCACGPRPGSPGAKVHNR